MPDDFPRDRPHLLLRNNGETEPYRRPNQMITPPGLPDASRGPHAEALAQARRTRASRRRASRWRRATRRRRRHTRLLSGGPTAGARNAPASIYLADRRQHMEVVAVREPEQPGDPLLASVFVPARAENYYLRKIEAYRTSDTQSGVREMKRCVTHRYGAPGDGALLVH